MISTRQHEISASQPEAAADTSHALMLGTPVLTLDGSLPVEYLEPGDRLITRDGVRRVVAVETTVLRHARMVRVGQDVLGPARPSQDLLVRADQPILVRDWRAQAFFGAAQAMIPAGLMLDGEFIRAEVLPEVRLYTLRLNAPATIYAGGLEVACDGMPVAA